MTIYTCEYCQTIFTAKSNLSRHQRRAKYCLQARSLESEEFLCRCGKQFSRKDNLRYHQDKCSYTDEIVKEVASTTSNVNDQVKMSDLIQLITTLIDRPTISNATSNRNVMLSNLEPITDAEIADHIRHLTIDFIHDGAKGYANFAGNYPFKDRLLCTDKARKKLRYKDNDGEIVDDANGTKITQRFFQAIAPRNEELINAEYNTLYQEVHQIATEGRAHVSNLTDLLTKASHLQELLTKCQEAANGEENELTKEFVTHLSRML